MIRAGDLRQQIEIQAKTVAYDSYNQPIETWSTAFTSSAQAFTEAGREVATAQKLHAETTIVFKLRYRSDITVLHRVRYAGRIFSILGVEDKDFGHVELRLSCKEVV